MAINRDAEGTIRLGDAVFEVASSDLRAANEQPIKLREKSRRVLRELALRNGEIVCRDDLFSVVWSGRSVTDDNLVQCIKEIRVALGDKDRRLLQTCVGRGYRLHGVREASKAAGALPTLLISEFRTTGQTEAVADLSLIIVEELTVAFSPRTGFDVTRDETFRDEALFVIDGRVSAAGETLRVFVQLLRGPSGAVAFAETWSMPTDAAGSFVETITEKIASVLRVNMYNHSGADFVDRDNTSLNTQELMTKAAYHMSRIQVWNRDEALAALTVAMKRDPRNPMVLAMRASVGVISILQEGYAKLPDPPEYCLELADRAVAISPQVDFVMLTRGCMRLWLNADHDGAREDFDRSLTGNPVFHLAHQFRAVSEILSGEPIPAIDRLKKIIELGTVNNPRYPHYLTLLALAELQTDATKAAFQNAREAHERAPSDPWCGYVYAAAAAGREEIVGSEHFREMMAKVELPFSHFRELPFTVPKVVTMLEDLLKRSGFPKQN